MEMQQRPPGGRPAHDAAQRHLKACRLRAKRARQGWRPWMLFGVASLFYFYEFFARVAPGVLHSELMKVSGASEGAFGFSMSLYFLAYAPAQLLVGRLLDRHGVRAVAAPASLLVALGCLLFATSDNIVLMGLGRFLQGLGSSVAYLGVIYLSLIWLPPQRHGMVPGMVTAIGTLGAATAQLPLLLISDQFGWRMPLLIGSVAGVIIASLIWCYLPRRPSWFVELMREDGFDPRSPEPMGFQLNRILHQPSLWILSLAAAGIYLPVSVIGDLWGVSFFGIEAGLPSDQASLITTVVFISFAIGAMVAGHWSDRIGRRKVLFSSGAISAASFALLLCFTSRLPVSVVVVLVGALGFTSGSQQLAFVMVADTAKRHTRAITLAFVNFVVMFFPVIVQPTVGLFSQWGLPAGARPSSMQELQGYSVVVVGMLAAAGLSLLVQDTVPRADEDVVLSH